MGSQSSRIITLLPWPSQLSWRWHYSNNLKMCWVDWLPIEELGWTNCWGWCPSDVTETVQHKCNTRTIGSDKRQKRTLAYICTNKACTVKWTYTYLQQFTPPVLRHNVFKCLLVTNQELFSMLTTFPKARHHYPSEFTHFWTLYFHPKTWQNHQNLPANTIA